MSNLHAGHPAKAGHKHGGAIHPLILARAIKVLEARREEALGELSTVIDNLEPLSQFPCRSVAALVDVLRSLRAALETADVKSRDTPPLFDAMHECLAVIAAALEGIVKVNRK
jgi:hypothetical protein